MKKETACSVEYSTDFPEFLRRIGQYGDQPAVSWYSRKQKVFTKSYRELTADIHDLQAALINRGLRGKHLAIAGENSYEWICVYLAATGCGCVAVCVDVEQSEENIRKMIRNADADAVFASASCLELFLEEKEPLFCLDAEPCVDVPTVACLIREGKEAEECPETAVEGTDTAVIAFTSGTTEGARPVMLSHRGILINAAECNLYVDAGKKIYSFLPFCHTYGMTSAVLATFCRGALLVLNGNTKMAMRDLKLSEAYSMLAVPLTVEALYKQLWIRAEQFGEEDIFRRLLKKQRLKRKLGIRKIPQELKRAKEAILGTVDVIICGGAYLNLEIAENFELFGVQVLQGYGITECSPLVSVNAGRDNHLKTVGKPIPSCKVRIVDQEIQVSGPCVMNGYYKMPEETAEVMKDGWFCTGDLGELNKDGYLKITGRRKNLIVFKNGKKVSPEAYEQKINQIPFVQEAMVYGASSGNSDDDVKIAVSVYPTKEVLEKMSSYEILEELQKAVDVLNDTLPLYQQIQIIHIREQEFEKTATRKIKRYVE